MRLSKPTFVALAFTAALTSAAQAADKTPQQVFADCIRDADTQKEKDLKLCTGKTGQILSNCQQRAQNTRVAADAICTARMQQAVNSAAAKAREAAAREAARRKN